MEGSQQKPWFRIRQGRSEDAEKIAALSNLAYLPDAVHFKHGSDRTNQKEVEQLFRLAESYFLVAELDKDVYGSSEEEGKLVGSIHYCHREEGVYFGMLSVHPQHQRKGLAAALIHRVTEHARAAGKAYLEIHVLNIVNKETGEDMRFSDRCGIWTDLSDYYRRIGFEEVAGRERIPWVEDCPVRDYRAEFVVMRKAL
ncbi:GNAT family N-acetyltransferase [Balamuthia mandrillaris]